METPLYLLSKVFPKRKDLSIIGSTHGKHFSDNPKYFYIHHYSTVKKVDSTLIWITKSKNVAKDLKNNGYPAEYLYSLKGIYTTLRASKAYISHHLDDIQGSLMGGAKIIQLWHGMPLRKIGFGGEWTNTGFTGKLKVFVYKWFPFTYYMKCDVLYAPCEMAKQNYLEAFSKSFRNNKISENILLVRQARTFCFNKDFVLSKQFFPEIDLLNRYNNQYDKIISWLPTQRSQLDKTIIDVIIDSKLDLIQFNSLCKSKNYLFVIKPHFLDYKEVINITKGLDNIFVYPFVDPYPLLKYTDILVTDYSSVCFDFLFLKRPIVFMCYDLNEYMNAIGSFYYDFVNLEMGPICENWDDLTQIIFNKESQLNPDKNVFKKFNFVQ